MAEPAIVQKSPYVLTLAPGTYWWCRCGRSDTQPFGDGSHQGGAFEPVTPELTEPTKLTLCGCKNTSNKPFCDGTHNELD